MTVGHLFNWACAQGILDDDTTRNLPKIKSGGDRKRKFKTTAEIEKIVERAFFLVPGRLTA
jgi:hypothetical protein